MALNVEELVKYMVKQDASDLYITVGLPPMYKIQGVIQPTKTQPLTPEITETLANAMMNARQKKEFDETYEQNLALFYPSLGRFRVNILRQMNCVAVVIRQIKTRIQTVEELLLPAKLNEIIMEKRGLILVVGATGSGKSTSLAGMVDYRNRNAPGHIITVEDPVEFVHQHKKSVITQREIGTDTLSFHNALRNTLRQAPDVILVGEIRDLETMEAAITFAETGHLCLGTLHSNNANQAIERIMNFFPPERHEQIYLQLGLNLRAIVSQRLVRTVDGKRAAAVEIMLNTPRVADLIKNGEVDLIKDAMEKSIQEGAQTFDQAIFTLYKEGRIAYDVALANADSANNLRLKIKVAGLPEPGEKGPTDFAFKEAERYEPKPGLRPKPAVKKT
jgi:twitching motility protein PilU